MDDTQPAETLEGETQSIHAWSQEDAATEVADYRPRSWKIPVALATVAVAAAVGAGVYLEWPSRPAIPTSVPQSAAKPQVAPIQSAPAKPLSQDQRFIALLKQRNVIVVSPPLAINGAHETCTNLANGFTAKQIAQAFFNVSPAETLSTAGTFVATAQEVYCPPRETS